MVLTARVPTPLHTTPALTMIHGESRSLHPHSKGEGGVERGGDPCGRPAGMQSLMRHDIIDIFLTTMLCYPKSTDTWYHYLGGTYMFKHRRAYPLLTISFIILFLLSA